MDAFEKWADDCDETDEKYYAIPVGSVARGVAREAFRAGMRAAALIVADHSPDTNPGSPCNAAVAAILAKADKP